MCSSWTLTPESLEGHPIGNFSQMYYVLLLLAKALSKFISTHVLQLFIPSHLRFDFEIASFQIHICVLTLVTLGKFF